MGHGFSYPCAGDGGKPAARTYASSGGGGRRPASSTRPSQSKGDRSRTPRQSLERGALVGPPHRPVGATAPHTAPAAYLVERRGEAFADEPPTLNREVRPRLQDTAQGSSDPPPLPEPTNTTTAAGGESAMVPAPAATTAHSPPPRGGASIPRTRPAAEGGTSGHCRAATTRGGPRLASLFRRCPLHPGLNADLGGGGQPGNSACSAM